MIIVNQQALKSRNYFLMNESKAQKKQSLLSTFIGHINLLPFTIALVLSSLLLYSWQIIKDEDDKRLLTEINGHLQHFSTQIKSHFESRFSLAYFLQQKWLLIAHRDAPSF